MPLVRDLDPNASPLEFFEDLVAARRSEQDPGYTFG
jgi:hypothetical protein